MAVIFDGNQEYGAHINIKATSNFNSFLDSGNTVVQKDTKKVATD